MRAHQIMTRNVLTTSPDASVADAAKLMLDNHISGLPVISNGELVGMISEGDLLRRVEIGTTRKHGSWLGFFVGSGTLASEFVRERGRKVNEIMTLDPVTLNEMSALDEIVRLMEKLRIRRIPVVADKKLVGIVTRADLLRAVASLSRDVPDPTADDDHIRSHVYRAIEQQDWKPLRAGVTVRDGNVHLYGIITDERHRRATIVAAENVAGVKTVTDHLAWFDPASGIYLPPADEALTRAG